MRILRTKHPNKDAIVWQFFKKSFILLTGFAIIYLVFLADIPETMKRVAVITGFGISYLNATVGFVMIGRGMSRDEKGFLLLVYGGMFFRILLIFVLLFILIKAFNFPVVTLLISLVASYFSFLVLEIIEMQKFSRDYKSNT